MWWSGAGSLASFVAGAGQDVVLGSALGDVINARDGEHDAISCAGGNDLLTADLRDPPISSTCEQVDLGAVREGPNVTVRSRTLAVGARGALVARLACPRSLDRPCTGTLAARLHLRGTRFGRSTRYSIRPGQSASVTVRLPGAPRPGARVRLRSLERGRHGAKTTLRSLPTRRRTARGGRMR